LGELAGLVVYRAFVFPNGQTCADNISGGQSGVYARGDVLPGAESWVNRFPVFNILKKFQQLAGTHLLGPEFPYIAALGLNHIAAASSVLDIPQSLPNRGAAGRLLGW